MFSLWQLKRLKIVEQIIIVLVLSVIVPMTISAVIVNNINQHAVRNELRYSALTISESIASNAATFARSGEDELKQIVLSLKYIKSDYLREVYLKDLLLTSKVISSMELVKKNDISKYKQWADYNRYNEHLNVIEIFHRIDDASALLAKINIDVFEDQIFNIYKKDDRQIYVLNQDKLLIAAHNYNENEFNRILSVLPKNLKDDDSEIFGKIKNQPMAYFKSTNPEMTIIVNTTSEITNETINHARFKIILALCLSAFFILFVVGLYTYYLYINIRQLIKGIMALSKGNYKRKIRLLKSPFTPHEIVFLSTEFNKMADEINTTYRKLEHTNKELKKLDEFRSNLIDTVSHEFRTPLTSIKGYTSRLLRQDIVIDDEMKIKSLRVIKNQSERLSRMVEDLLVIPDIEGAKLNINLESVNVLDVINNASLTTKHKVERQVDIKIPENIPFVVADKDRLEQVFVNLLENAYKYSYENTVVSVYAKLSGEYVEVVISNESDYVTPEKLNKLFDKFIRLDDKTTRTTRGTGLGLFIVKGIVLAMNGQIELKSTKNNIFSVVVKLPIVS